MEEKLEIQLNVFKQNNEFPAAGEHVDPSLFFIITQSKRSAEVKACSDAAFKIKASH